MPDTAPDISLGAGDRIAVGGCLDVDTVAAYKDAGLELMEDLNEIVVDLDQCRVEGSAVIALLIAWQRSASQAGKEISFVNAPENLLQIAEACGVRHIVPFK